MVNSQSTMKHTTGCRSASPGTSSTWTPTQLARAWLGHTWGTCGVHLWLQLPGRPGPLQAELGHRRCS